MDIFALPNTFSRSLFVSFQSWDGGPVKMSFETEGQGYHVHYASGSIHVFIAAQLQILVRIFFPLTSASFELEWLG